MKIPLTVGQVAAHFGCRAWQIRRLFERNILPPPRRIGAFRVINPAELPKIEKALRKVGYLAPEAPSRKEARSNA